MLSRTGNRRRFVAGLAGVPAVIAGARWLAPASVAAADEGTPASVTADEGLQRLIDGNKRFVEGNLTSLGSLGEDRAQLTSGQSPFAIIVCCSDSRVPPELVFDQTLGELFVVRTAGQVLDEAARSSIVYGVDVLKAPLILVLGHSSCGAVEAAIAAVQGADIPAFAYPFAEGIGPAVRSVLDAPGNLMDNAIKANVELGVERLRMAEPTLAAAVREGRVTVTGGVYDLASGEVTMLG